MTPLTVTTATVAQTYNGVAFAPTVGALTYSVTPDFSHLLGTLTVTGSAVGAVHAGTYTEMPGGLYSDQLGYIIAPFAQGTLTINPAPLTVTGTTASKVYDGTTVAVLTGGTLLGVLNSDTVTLTQAGTYATKNVGTGMTVTAADTLTGTNLGDYSLTEPNISTGIITPATLTVGGTMVGGKVYNGTTMATLTGGTLSGVIGADAVSLSQVGSFVSKNVGSGIMVTASDSLGGASASDYSIAQPGGLTGSITPAALSVAGTTVGNSVYNGTTGASLSGGTLVGVVNGDTVSLAQAGTYASKNAGTGVAVTATDSLSGSSAGDYTITEPIGLTGTITPASLTVTGTTVGNRVYNGTTMASLMGGTLVGVVNGDMVSLAQGGTYASKNAGTGIAVTATDALSGASASDYSLTQPAGLTGTITPDYLNVTGTLVGSKVYNGTSSAPLTGGTLVGVIAGDTVTLIQAGTFASASPGSGIAVTVTDSLSGANASDYGITEPAGLTGTISPGAGVSPITPGTPVTAGAPVTSTPTNPSAPVTPVNPITPVTSTPTSPSAPAQVAQTASTQVQSSFASPQLGGGPQSISASPTIVAMNLPSGGGAASSTTTSTPAASGDSTASSPDAATATATASNGSSSSSGSSEVSGSSSSGGSSPSSGTAATGDSSTAVPVKQKAVAVNVSMKIGATGTLTIQSGGLRLPQNLTVANQ